MGIKLALDIGNTRVKWGAFSEGLLQDKGTGHFPDFELPEDIAAQTTHAIISATGSYNLPFDFLPGEVKPILLSADLDLPVKSDYLTPETIGSDRIAAYHGAAVLYPGNTLSIDIGTCITYDLVENGRVHRGGMISPGLKMRLRAMNEFTHALPLAEIPPKAMPLGLSTAEALGQGALFGTAREVEGIIGYFKDRFKGIKILLTGGDAGLLAENIHTEVILEPDLVLFGLHEILTHHVN